MDEAEALKKLSLIKQQHLMRSWNEMTLQQQKSFLNQIAALDVETFQLQQSLLKASEVTDDCHIEPFENYALSGNAQNRLMGRRLIDEGKVGCLLVAGGQGTRLQFNGPKGMYPISVIKHKSLFQLFAERVVAASKQAGRLLPLAIMTSPLNHEATLKFFEENHFFGLKQEQISFFSQGMLPFLDKEGNLFLSHHTLAQGPDGNGSSLQHFVSQGICKQWQKQGIQYVNYVLIDNPLADPFDAELIGFHHHEKADVTVKCTQKRTAHEKVGVVAKQEGKVHVVEYTELSEAQRTAHNKDGSLQFSCANLSLFCFSMDFIHKHAKTNLPLHKSFKSVNNGTGESPKGWKFERFIFDLLPLANKVKVILYPRELCFAPLKNLTGEDSPEQVKKALQLNDRRVFEEISGIAPPNKPFELSPQFYYPTSALLSHWKGTPFPNTDYV